MPVSRSCPTPRPPWLFCRAGSRTTTPFTRTPACDSSRLASSAASVLNPPSYLSGQTGCTPREHSAKDPKKGYGVMMADGQWYYYDKWLSVVEEDLRKRKQ